MTARATTDEAVDAPATAGDVLIEEHPVPRIIRSPADLLRLLVALGLTLIGVIFALAAKDVLASVDLEIARLFDHLPDAFGRFLVGLVGLFALVVPILAVVLLLVLRRFRLLATAVLASVVGAGLMWLVGHFVLTSATPALVKHILERPSWVVGAGFPDAVYLAGATAAVAAASPWCGRPWRRTLVLAIVSLAVFRIASATVLSGDVLIALGVGVVVGSAVLLTVGSPSRRPRAQDVADAMARNGTPLRELRRAEVEARGSMPYAAVAADGTPIFVKVLGQDERSADLLYRAYRFLRLRDVGDERPFQSTHREVEHEALRAGHHRAVRVAQHEAGGVGVVERRALQAVDIAARDDHPEAVVVAHLVGEGCLRHDVERQVVAEVGARVAHDLEAQAEALGLGLLGDASGEDGASRELTRSGYRPPPRYGPPTRRPRRGWTC